MLQEEQKSAKFSPKSVQKNGNIIESFKTVCLHLKLIKSILITGQKKTV